MSTRIHIEDPAKISAFGSSLQSASRENVFLDTEIMGMYDLAISLFGQKLSELFRQLQQLQDALAQAEDDDAKESISQRIDQVREQIERVKRSEDAARRARTKYEDSARSMQAQFSDKAYTIGSVLKEFIESLERTSDR